MFSFRHELRHQSCRARLAGSPRASDSRAQRSAQPQAFIFYIYIFLFWILCGCAAAGGAHSTPETPSTARQRKPSSRLKTHILRTEPQCGES